MHRLDVILLDGHRGNVISELQKTGITQIDFVDDKEVRELNLERTPPLERITEISRELFRTSRLINLLKQFDTRKTPFLDALLGVENVKKQELEESTWKELVGESSKLTDKLEPEVLDITEKIQSISSRENEATKEIDECSLFLHDIKLEDMGESKYTYTLAGHAESTEGVSEALEERFGRNFALMTPAENNVLICVLREAKEELEEMLSTLGIKKIAMPKNKGSLLDYCGGLEDELKKLRYEKARLTAKLRKIYEENYQQLLVNKELLEIEKERAQIVVSGAKTNKTSFIRVWVPADKSREIQTLIKWKSHDNCEIIVDKDPDPEKAPTLMYHNYMKPFQFVTSMYGIPKYGQIDPTMFAVPALILLTGLMIADAAYGLVLLGISLAMYRKYAGMSQGVKNLSLFLMMCAIATIGVGVVMGDYFGTLVHDWYAVNVLNLHSLHEIEEAKLPLQIFHPESIDLIVILYLSVIGGVCHLVLGTLLGFYNDWKLGHKKKAITHYLAWSFFGVGLGIFLDITMGSMFSEQLSHRDWLPLFSPYMINVAAAMIFGGLVLAFIGSKLMVLLEFLDFFAFTLSYARVMALLVGAGAVATAFNQVAAIAWEMGSAFGIVLAIIIFILGQGLHFALGVLSGFVQAMRLVYVEHFSRYYQGGGRVFMPFVAKRKYTILKEE